MSIRTIRNIIIIVRAIALPVKGLKRVPVKEQGILLPRYYPRDKKSKIKGAA